MQVADRLFFNSNPVVDTHVGANCVSDLDLPTYYIDVGVYLRLSA